MNSRQRRKLERQAIRFLNKFTILFQSHVSTWEKDDTITKEEIIKQLKAFKVL